MRGFSASPASPLWRRAGSAASSRLRRPSGWRPSTHSRKGARDKPEAPAFRHCAPRSRLPRSLRPVPTRFVLAARSGRRPRGPAREPVARGGSRRRANAATLWHRALEGTLFGVRALDPLTYAVVAGVLLAVVGVASSLPAWRASRVAAMAALRSE